MDSNAAATSARPTGGTSPIAEMKKKHSQDRENLSLAKQPVKTLKYFSIYGLRQLGLISDYITSHRLSFSLSLIFAVLVGIITHTTDGPHNLYLKETLAWARYVVWWVALGVASSIGLGSGLHTFVIYLGPHIALFTLKATQCGRVDLKSAPYDTAQWGSSSSWASKTCSEIGEPLYLRLASESERYMVPLHSVLLQIQLEAILWGIGTAFGELPPYFMSRQARLAGERLKELDELVSTGDAPVSLLERLKLWMINHFQNFGFFTILLFASIPNPLFDLAGILCGQFLVPFWKFFTATLIGKAIIKTHIQTVFIIMVSNPYVIHLVGLGLAWLIDHLPAFAHFTPSITAALENASCKFSSTSSSAVARVPTNNTLAFAWNTFVLLLMLGFAASIVASVAQGVLVEEQRSELLAVEAQQEEDLSPSVNSGHDRTQQ
ncbi:unnamed protein product [Calypogeia fissa]